MAMHSLGHLRHRSLRILVGAAATGLVAGAIHAAPATAAPTDSARNTYVTLNEKGLTRALIPESWGPRWFGPIEKYTRSVSTNVGVIPTDCFTTGKQVQGTKSSSFAEMGVIYEQSKDSHSLSYVQLMFQYPDKRSAQRAWNDFTKKVSACPGTYSYPIRDSAGKKIGEATSVITVEMVEGLYGHQQMIVNEDVRLVKPLPHGAKAVNSGDEISIWSFDGLVMMEIESNKYVPREKNWVFSPSQVATLEALALTAIQRYHRTAVRAL